VEHGAAASRCAHALLLPCRGSADGLAALRSATHVLTCIPPVGDFDRDPVRAPCGVSGDAQRLADAVRTPVRVAAAGARHARGGPRGCCHRGRAAALAGLSEQHRCLRNACMRESLHAASDCMVAGRRLRRLRRRVGGRGVAAARHARGRQAVAARTSGGDLAAAARGARRACACLPTRRHLRRVPPCLLRAAAAAAAERGAAKQALDAACWARAAAQARRSLRAPRSVTSRAATWRTLCPCCKPAWRRRAPGMCTCG
jgi:hypothetical protein